MLKICFATPSFNQAKFVEEGLLSVKQQHYPDVEHILTDGASTDGTAELLRRNVPMPEWNISSGQPFRVLAGDEKAY